MGLPPTYLCQGTFTQVSLLLPHTPSMGTRQGEPFQTTSLTLCSLHKLPLSAKAEEKLSIISTIGGAPFCAGNPPGTKGGGQPEESSRERENAGRLGWEVCRALIPLHQGTDFNKAGCLQTLRADSCAAVAGSSALFCVQNFPISGFPIQKMTAL